MIKLTSALKTWLIDHGRSSAIATDDEFRDCVAEAMSQGSLSAENYKSLALSDEGEEPTMTTTAQRIFSKGAGGVRVKGASEAYSDTKHAATHVKTGRKVFDEDGDEVAKPSQLALAQSGAFLKFAARRAGIAVEWTEHDQALFTDLLESHEWASHQGEPHECKIFAPGAIKAPLLDDSTSGGLEAAPIVFDDAWISTPLLTGELLPEVDLKPIARGRRIEAASIGTPTVVWNEGDAAVGTLFDSTGQIAALDSTVFDLSCHVIVGRNFLSDSPLQVGAALVQLIGERMSEAIETVIAEGDGTTQPQGIKGAAGTTSVSFASAAATVAKYLELLFSVPKQLRMGDNRFCFIANETTYRRARSIATGVTGDTRLVYGMSVEDYAIFQRPFKICPALANTEILAGAMARYRLYRRLGTSVEWSTQGENLQRRNEALLTVRQRWAGRPMIPSAFSVVTNAEG
jgi:HK97 family phage major capsid protein